MENKEKFNWVIPFMNTLYDDVDDIFESLIDEEHQETTRLINSLGRKIRDLKKNIQKDDTGIE